MRRPTLLQVSKAAVVAVMAAMTMLLSSLGGVAGAAPSYPPPTTTIPTSPAFIDSSELNPEFVSVGSSLTYNISGCLPNTVATFTINGAAAGQQTTDATGTISFAIAWNNATATVNSGPAVPAHLGLNTVTATCQGPSGPLTRTGYFHLTANGGGGGGGSSGGLAFTGAEIAMLALVASGLILGGGVLLLTGSRRSSRRHRS